jgi:hypothetical protein
MTRKRYLNVQYADRHAEINITGMDRLFDLQREIEQLYSRDFPEVSAIRVQLWNRNGDPPNELDDLDDIKALPDAYFRKRKEQGALLLTIQLLPPPTASAQVTRSTPLTLIRSRPALTAFWNALKAYKTPFKGGEVIRLPDNVFILGYESMGSAIFIRPCYPKLLETALSIIDGAEAVNMAILGNPGIGKTYFGYFLLFHLARTGATVVYEYGKEEHRFLFSPNAVLQGTRYDFAEYLDLKSTYFIVDAAAPRPADAKTILVSSLRREIWKEFVKDRCQMRFMPIWSLDEIKNCRAKLFDRLSEDEVVRLFGRWGGIPRHVLENARNVVYHTELDAAVDAVDLNLLLNAIGNAQAANDASHRLVHMDVEDDFITRSYRLGSTYLSDKVYAKLFDKKRAELMDFLATSQGVGDVAVLRGILFERHAHRIISNGGEFQIRELHDSDPNPEDSHMPMTQVFPRLEQLVFEEDAQVQASTDRYFRPRIDNYKSVDAFVKPAFLFQMTCAKTHPCKQAGIHKVLNLLGNPKDPILFFVVPKERFSDFRYQRYEDAQGKTMQEPTYANVKQVKQFVVAIDLTSK